MIKETYNYLVSELQTPNKLEIQIQTNYSAVEQKYACSTDFIC